MNAPTVYKHAAQQFIAQIQAEDYSQAWFTHCSTRTVYQLFKCYKRWSWQMLLNMICRPVLRMHLYQEFHHVLRTRVWDAMDRLSVVGNESTWLGCNLPPRWGHELLRCTVRSHTKIFTARGCKYNECSMRRDCRLHAVVLQLGGVDVEDLRG